jgi:hypothetical protein
MNAMTRLCILACCLPLAAQSPADRRVDSASVGLGYGEYGYLLTTMNTGPTWGWFMGLEGLPDTSTPTTQEPGSGTARWVQHKGSTGAFHLGAAYRLDSRWVVGLGVGYARTTYRYTFNPGSAPFPFYTQLPEPGPVDDHTVGVVAMVDVRVGQGWGFEMVGGSTGLGGAVTFRF